MIADIQNIKQFKLPGQDKTGAPEKWLFLDTETTEQLIDCRRVHVFKIGWSCYVDRSKPKGQGRERWRFWDDSDKLNAYIETLAVKEDEILLAGHNIFFDLQACGFFEYFTRTGWQVNWLYDKGLTYILRIVRDKTVIIIASTTNWFNFSLARLGEMVGLNKIEIDFDQCTPAELKRYCRRDVAILIKSVDYLIDFIQRHDLGRLALTRGAQAFTAYRHKYMDIPIYVHKEERIKEFERKAYFGGRTEAFFLGQVRGGPFVSLDVNSMYPHVMREQRYPVELVEYGERRSLDNLAEISTKYGIIVEAEIETPEPVFAVRYNGKTVFPTGHFIAHLCTGGFRYAFERNYIRKVHFYSIYRMDRIFTRWVDELYALKVKYTKEDNQPMLILVKAMLNSLYGKFGQRMIKSDMYTDTGTDHYSREEVLCIDTGDIVVITRMLNTEIVQYSEGEGVFSVPSIAAHVTEYARLYLWDIIKRVGPDKVLYCDTDSVKIRKKDMDPLMDMIDSQALGKLKIENETHQLYIGGAKSYRTEESRHIKGIPKMAVEVEPGVFEYTSFARQPTLLRKRQITGVELKEMKRTLTERYDKGKKLPNGKVIPYEFSLHDLPF